MLRILRRNSFSMSLGLQVQFLATGNVLEEEAQSLAEDEAACICVLVAYGCGSLDREPLWVQ